MKEEVINDIINSLHESTNDGAIEWELSSISSDTEKTYDTYTIDRKTKFSIKISLNTNMSMKSDGWDYLLIQNESIIDSRKFLYVRQFSEVGKLANLIYQKYFKPTIVIINEESIYKDILSGIGDRQYNRDKKLSSLLGDDSSQVDGKAQKEGFLKRIFGK